MAVYQLRRVQLGKQTAYTTPVAATSLLRGVLDAGATLQAEDLAPEELGLLAAPTMSVLQARQAEVTMELQATYQDVLYALFGLFGAVTPTGSAPTFTWTFNAQNTSAPNAQVYTVEYGMAGAEYRAVGAVLSEWTLSSTAGEGLRESWTMTARTLQPQAMTTGLPIRIVDPISAVHGGLWIDATSAAHGTTQFTDCLIESELSISTNRHAKVFDGLYPSSWGDGKWEAKLRLVLEWTAQVKALVDALESGLVARHIRLRWQQSASRSLTIDFAGVLTSAPELFGDRDGNATVELEFSALMTSSFAGWLTVAVVNNVSTLP